MIAYLTPGLGLHKLLDVPQRNCAVNVIDYCCHGADAGHFKASRVSAVVLLWCLHRPFWSVVGDLTSKVYLVEAASSLECA